MKAREEREAAAPMLQAGVLSIRPGHGANCSSVGSVVDLLFAASVGGGALVVAVTAALAAREEAVAQEGALESAQEGAAPDEDGSRGDPGAGAR